ncbi:MAG TPA: HAD hydrolase family protein [Methylomirabilota bacterium]|nr:HAD hydrolase family protein [Methylomirabilota bacterium]
MSSHRKILEQRIRSVRLIAFDFDGVFTDNKVYVFQDGSEAVCCFRGDGLGLEKLKRLGIQAIIVSTEVNPVVGFRSKKLGVRCIQACPDKRAALEGVARELELSLNQVAFVGNDINDLSCLRAVGLPIVVRDAHPDVVRTALYQSQALGGQGAVREVCDLFASILEEESALPRRGKKELS